MRRKAHPHEHQGELNIVPYLDIMVNLVMFMLMSMTGFVSFQMINVNLPSIGISTGNPDQPPPETEQKLNLTVIMAPKGYYIAAKGGTLPQQVANGITGGDASAVDTKSGAPTIPTKGGVEYAYDYEKLASVMAEIRKANPAVSQYYLSPDRAAKYDTVVQTMDYARPAFPDVAFAALKL